NQLGLGIHSDGSIGVPTAAAPPGETGTGLSLNGGDFLVHQGGQDIESCFGGIVNGFIFRNSGNGNQSDISVSIPNEHAAHNRRLTSEGACRGLGVRRTLSFGINDTCVAIDITRSNNTAQTLAGLAWMEGVNPQIGL